MEPLPDDWLAWDVHTDDPDARVQLILDEPTSRLRLREVWVRPGRINADVEEWLGFHSCHRLAGAIASLSGWPVVTFEVQHADGRWQADHSAAQLPDGRVMDIHGVYDTPDQIAERLSDGGTRALRHRVIPSGQVPALLRDGAEGIGDPHWWVRTPAMPVRVLLLHYARLLIRQHGYESALPASPEQYRQRGSVPASTPTVIAIPQPAPHPQHTTTTPGGSTVTSVDELRATITALIEMAADTGQNFAYGGRGLAQMHALLTQVAASSNQQVIHQAIAAYAEAMQMLDQATSLIAVATDSVGYYAAHL